MNCLIFKISSCILLATHAEGCALIVYFCIQKRLSGDNQEWALSGLLLCADNADDGFRRGGDLISFTCEQLGKSLAISYANSMPVRSPVGVIVSV